MLGEWYGGHLARDFGGARGMTAKLARQLCQPSKALLNQGKRGIGGISVVVWAGFLREMVDEGALLGAPSGCQRP